MEIFTDPKFSKLSKYYYYTLLLTIFCFFILSESTIFILIYLILSIVAITYFDIKLLKIYRNTIDLKEYNKLETEYIQNKGELQKCKKENEELKIILEDKEVFLQAFEKDYFELKEIILSIHKKNEEIKSNNDYNEVTNIDSDLTKKLINSKVLIIKDESENISYDLIQEADFVIIAKDNRILKNKFGNIGRIISIDNE